ncbi:hypothetical protein JYT79_02710 [Cardiobacterium sp. AH-315-I02]|nr:hypothetical protein [Cardiobacterium sp. AH-315-I02]
MTTTENIETMKGVGGLLLILAIYLAVKFTKNLNSNGTRKSRNIKRTITIVAGVISMVLATVILVVPNVINKKSNTELPQEIQSSSITAITTSQGAGGTLNINLDKETLKKLESEMVGAMVDSLKSEYIKRGYTPNFNDIISTSKIISIGGMNLVVIKTTINKTQKTTMILGIKDDELRRVSCSRVSSNDIPIESGKCAEEIHKSLGVSLKK